MVASALFNTSRFFIKSKPVKNLLIQRSFTTSQIVLKEFKEPTKGRSPLEGVRVLDLTRVLGKYHTHKFLVFKLILFLIAGPYCTMMLGDLG